MVETPEFARRILSGENKKWEMTFCSATVQKTAEEIFGIILPRGNPIQILPEYR